MGPYRETMERALCSECKEPAPFECCRCQRPSCDEHRPGERNLCPACLAEWKTRHEEINEAFWKKAAQGVMLGGFLILPIYPVARWIAVRRGFRRFVEKT